MKNAPAIEHHFHHVYVLGTKAEAAVSHGDS